MPALSAPPAGVMLYTMLFARYPFERPEDKKLDQHARLQRILHRIIKARGEGGGVEAWAAAPACPARRLAHPPHPHSEGGGGGGMGSTPACLAPAAWPTRPPLSAVP